MTYSANVEAKINNIIIDETITLDLLTTVSLRDQLFALNILPKNIDDILRKYSLKIEIHGFVDVANPRLFGFSLVDDSIHIQFNGNAMSSSGEQIASTYVDYIKIISNDIDYFFPYTLNAAYEYRIIISLVKKQDFRNKLVKLGMVYSATIQENSTTYSALVKYLFGIKKLYLRLETNHVDNASYVHFYRYLDVDPSSNTYVIPEGSHKNIGTYATGSEGETIIDDNTIPQEISINNPDAQDDAVIHILAILFFDLEDMN